jgi:probable HAF family extracellular repeat protein
MRGVATIIVSLALVSSAAGQTATFRPLGALPGGSFQSGAAAVSADGSVIVGFSVGLGGPEAVRWTGTGGPQSLGASTVYAWAVSADGSVIGGATRDSGPAFRWTAATGPLGLGTLPGGGSRSEARGVSGDGAVVVGIADHGDGSNAAFRWTAQTGMQAFLPVSGESEAWGISADGSAIVGVLLVSGVNSYRFTSAQGMQLVDPDQVFAVSADGSTVVGGDGFCGAFRWTPSGGVQCLGALPGQNSAYGTALSADGSVVVGWSRFPYHSFIWDAAHGIRDLRDVLVTNYGLDLTGWTLDYAFGVSADAQVIVGWGTNPCGQQEGWAVYLGSAQRCYANCDGSTSPPVLNVNDFACFLAAFAAGDAYANCDGSCAAPTLNVNDFACFLTRFAAGCP